ncbi:Ig-like domain-containing protein [Glycomyces sp. TRM65418]|uniref:L,D-transpeptidase n=1 Tax=Glycomyces sp. TRM65418 TaxID=2867006 RepID=UPI001CE6F30D|nr:Ig-like domain-containing protein [Glycomyces sp. TRM65418]MCC3762084.1 Ig-like domain-containing protein [Glycomyces sp. TRM65418]QZD56152.1 L,D-transpeptidase family protein [Glycomyces sp. TRM65418]
MSFGPPSLSRRGALTAGGLAAMSLAAACSKESGTIDGSGDDAASSEAPQSAAQIQITPADGAADATAATEIAWTVEAGEFKEFKLTDAAGTAVEGAMHPDGTTWVPASPLEWETTYTATVTADDAEGLTATATSTFTTIASPGDRVGLENYLPGVDSTVGQGAILAFRFNGHEIPEDLRASVERRLFVTSEPAQEGSWHWITPRALEYRPKEYWQPNTQVTVRLALGGLDLGDGRYGEYDQETSFTIDSEARLLEADDDTKQMKAYRDGSVVQTIPISLGADEIDGIDARSYSGTMTIMSREEDAIFRSDLFDYETPVKWAMRLTFSGQFIHGAPWAADRLGNSNGSHGCINVSDEMGEWIYNFVRWGDPVVVKNTGKQVPPGDGFTAWSLDWDTFKEGSYLS